MDKLLIVLLIACAASLNGAPKPHTSFQTPTGYLPKNDIRTDAVIIYTDQKPQTQSWIEKGFVPQTMYGFRTGADYIKGHADEGQTMSNGEILTCGPGSFYMVPTQSRIDAAIRYFRNAIDSGTTAVIPEEPEFFTQTGYSESFKKEWQDYYGEPWQDQMTSINARWKSGRLKSYLEYRMVKSILEDARAYKSDVTRMVAAHSPVSYCQWGIIYPHYEVLMLPELQEMIGQVWTGTARSPCKYEGTVTERTFEYGLLEYSSLYNLTRGTGKRLWFLMDPLEDNPDRSMDDYQTNYEKTLVASLMFPEVDEFEVMPWPTRIFGRVPGEFATKIMSIVTMLGDIHNQGYSVMDTGTRGIATLVADSMAWQRGEPNASDYDGPMGLTLPLVMAGIPIDVAQLERSPEPGYLDEYKVILLSYDYLKPMDAAYNRALADWVRKGGTLVLFGGDDAYNAVDEWWRADSFDSPQEHLLKTLGVQVKDSVSLSSSTEYDILGREDRPIRALENRDVHVFDVTDYVHDGQVFIKFEDSLMDDGWGPSVFSAQLRVDGEVVQSFKPGTDFEREHIFLDGGMLNAEARFADRDGYWVYTFDLGQACSPDSPGTCCPTGDMSGRKVEVAFDMGNQYVVSAAKSVPTAERLFRANGDGLLARAKPEFAVPASIPVTAYDADAEPLYYAEGTRLSPFFEKRIGKGTLVFTGIAPQYFAASKESAEMLRLIARRACETAGLEYREQHYMKARRGRYVAVRAFDKPITLKSKFVDVLDPGLRLVAHPTVKAGGLGVFADVSDLVRDTKPRILLSSNRIEERSESADETTLLTTGPLETKGIVRISTAGRRVKSITALGPDGKAVAFEQSLDQGTLAVTYDGLPDGVRLTVRWE